VLSSGGNVGEPRQGVRVPEWWVVIWLVFGAVGWILALVTAWRMDKERARHWASERALSRKVFALEDELKMRGWRGPHV
jgi:hypothetical protein